MPVMPGNSRRTPTFRHMRVWTTNLFNPRWRNTASQFTAAGHIQRRPIKNVALYFCPYFWQLLTDFQNFFTSTHMQTICNNVIIIHSTTLYMCLYTTLWNINEICIYNDKNFSRKTLGLSNHPAYQSPTQIL